MFGVFIVTHHPAGSQDAHNQTIRPPALERPEPTPTTEPASDDDLAALAQLGDVDHASRLSADWRFIEKPLAPYKKLVKGVEP